MYGLLRTLILGLLRAPQHPPDAPPGSEGSVQVFRASKKLLVLRLIPIAFMFLVVCGSLAVSLAVSLIGAAGSNDAPLVVVAVVVGLTWVLFAFISWGRYLMVRLDYDMRYYVVTDRSIRIREGAMRIHEHTYTYANIQNLAIHQGPLERLLGIANVRIQTAGGGGAPVAQAGVPTASHGGTLRGIENAEEVRDQILRLLKAYRDAGLGDTKPLSAKKNVAPSGRQASSPELVAALESVRDEVRALSSVLT